MMRILIFNSSVFCYFYLTSILHFYYIEYVIAFGLFVNFFILTVTNMNEQRKLFIQEILALGAIIKALYFLIETSQDIVVLIGFVSNVTSNLYFSLLNEEDKTVI